FQPGVHARHLRRSQIGGGGDHEIKVVETETGDLSGAGDRRTGGGADVDVFGVGRSRAIDFDVVEDRVDHAGETEIANDVGLLDVEVIHAGEQVRDALRRPDDAGGEVLRLRRRQALYRLGDLVRLGAVEFGERAGEPDARRRVQRVECRRRERLRVCRAHEE